MIDLEKMYEKELYPLVEKFLKTQTRIIFQNTLELNYP